MPPLKDHTHNGTDSSQLYAGDALRDAPQPALTTEDTATVNSGDPTTDDVIDNIRTRLGELETYLQTLGIIK